MGCENASFQVPKVLAVGQTSGSGGWVKKLASVTMRGNGLWIAFGNPEKNNGQFDLPCEGGKSEIGSLHGVPALEKRTLAP